MKEIPELIKAYRITHDLTTQQMADMVGMSTASINQFERGLREPTEKALKKILSVISPSSLKEFEDKIKPPSDDVIPEEAEETQVKTFNFDLGKVTTVKISMETMLSENITPENNTDIEKVNRIFNFEEGIVTDVLVQFIEENTEEIRRLINDEKNKALQDLI